MKISSFSKKRILNNILYPLTAMLFLLAVWWIVSAIYNERLILPTPIDAFIKLWALLKKGSTWAILGVTTFRSIRSFLYGVLLAGILAVPASRFNSFRAFLEPIISFLRAIPTMSIILIVIIWLGSSMAPILIAFLITFPILYSSFYSALISIDPKIIAMAKVYKVKTPNLILNLYAPAIANTALESMRASISLSVKVVIASEVMAQTKVSIGLYMQRSMVQFDTASLLAWTIGAIFCSFLLEGIIEAIRVCVVRWNR